ncbi:MAG: ATP-binding protein [Acidimicrobiales bacterium]
MSGVGSFSSIGSKIFVRTVVVALIPLITLSAVVLIGLNQLSTAAGERVDETRQLLSQESIGVNAEAHATAVARELTLVLKERIGNAMDWARSPVVIADVKAADEFSRSEGLAALPIDELEARFEDRKSTGVAFEAQTFLRDEIAARSEFREVFFTDSFGYNAGLTDLTSDFVQSDEDWWQEAWTQGISVSDVDYDESAGVFSVDISVRIDDQDTGRRLGVLKTVLSIDYVQDITQIHSSDNLDFMVALADGRLIADTATGHESSRMMNEELGIVAGDEDLVAAFAAAESGSAIGDERVLGFVRTDDPLVFGDDLGGFAGFDWIVVASEPAEVAFASLRGLEGLENDIETSGRSLRTLVVLLLVGGMGIAFVMSRFLANGLVVPIRRLTKAASEAAETGLPALVARLDDPDADLDSIQVPDIDLHTGDELEQLAASFNSVQGTAVRLAGEQAINRRKTSDMFVNLGRRNNSLIKRQLRFIDGLERAEADPETLDSLFKLDHLATRMRRNAESLLVLAGERSPRRWSAPVDIDNAVHAALAEVEEYERVEMSSLSETKLQGNVVADLAHVLAELIENALSFSPPQAPVRIIGRRTNRGYAITVSDEGLGMAPEELAEANQRLSVSYDLSQVPTQALGLYVVGRLSQLHGIEVTLAASSRGGTTATVLVPSSLVTTEVEVEDDPDTADTAVGSDAHAETGAATDDGGPDLADEVTVVEAEGGGACIGAVAGPLAGDEVAVAGGDDAVGEGAEVAVAGGAEVAVAEDDDQTMSESGASDADDDGSDTTTEAERVAALGDDERAAKRADDTDDAGIDARRRPDEPAEKVTVTVGGTEFTRRARADDSGNPGRRTSDEAGNDQAGTTAGANRAGPGTVAPPAGTAAAPAGTKDELAKFGFRRRQAVEREEAPAPEGERPPTDPVSEERAVATAEENRNQWSSFQRGKAAAESTPSDPSSRRRPDQASKE